MGSSGISGQTESGETSIGCTGRFSRPQNKNKIIWGFPFHFGACGDDAACIQRSLKQAGTTQRSGWATSSALPAVGRRQGGKYDTPRPKRKVRHSLPPPSRFPPPQHAARESSTTQLSGGTRNRRPGTWAFDLHTICTLLQSVLRRRALYRILTGMRTT